MKKSSLQKCCSLNVCHNWLTSVDPAWEAIDTMLNADNPPAFGSMAKNTCFALIWCPGTRSLFIHLFTRFVANAC